MKKIFLLTTSLLLAVVSYTQTMICWKSEVVVYKPSSGQMEPIAKQDMNSEAFFNDTYIRVNDDKLYLTKRRITSRQKSNDGTVTIYDVVDDKGSTLVVTVVEDRNGIFRMMVTQNSNSDYGIVYYFKNR